VFDERATWDKKHPRSLLVDYHGLCSSIFFHFESFLSRDMKPQSIIITQLIHTFRREKRIVYS